MESSGTEVKVVGQHQPTDDQAGTTAKLLIARTANQQAQVETRRATINAFLSEAARVLRDEYGAQQVLLIGSLDLPWFSLTSDVDLVVSGMEPQRAAEAQSRVASIIKARVDLLLLEELETRFRADVLATGRVIP